MEKIIVSLTTISHRLEKLHLTLTSILEQDYRNIEVHVYTSREAFLLDEGVHDIPEACRILLRGDARVRWFSTENIGSYRKLLPVLADTIGSDTLIATADDDTIYPRDWLANMYYYYRRHSCIVAVRCHAMLREKGRFLNYRSWMQRPMAENPGIFWLPTGKDGVLYNAAFFHKGVLDYVAALKFARTGDDLWFKWHTAVLRVPVYVIHTDYKSSTLEDTNHGPSLYKNFNEAGANDAAIIALETYAEETLKFRLADA